MKKPYVAPVVVMATFVVERCYDSVLSQVGDFLLFSDNVNASQQIEEMGAHSSWGDSDDNGFF